MDYETLINKKFEELNELIVNVLNYDTKISTEKLEVYHEWYQWLLQIK